MPYDETRRNWYRSAKREVFLQISGEIAHFKNHGNCMEEAAAFCQSHPEDALMAAVLAVAVDSQSWQLFAQHYSKIPSLVELLETPILVPEKCKLWTVGHDVADARGESILWSRKSDTKNWPQLPTTNEFGLIEDWHSAETCACAVNEECVYDAWPVTVWRIEVISQDPPNFAELSSPTR